MKNCETCFTRYECEEVPSYKIVLGCINNNKYKPDYQTLESQLQQAKDIIAKLIKDSKFMRYEYSDMNESVNEAEIFISQLNLK